MIRLRPETIGQANRLPGLTPAAVVAVLRHLKRQQVAEARSLGNEAPAAQAPATKG
jgi:tRNA uridine 5-carboxymethylaminomethyl modification enzyme